MQKRDSLVPMLLSLLALCSACGVQGAPAENVSDSPSLASSSVRASASTASTFHLTASDWSKLCVFSSAELTKLFPDRSVHSSTEQNGPYNLNADGSPQDLDCSYIEGPSYGSVDVGVFSYRDDLDSGNSFSNPEDAYNARCTAAKAQRDPGDIAAECGTLPSGRAFVITGNTIFGMIYAPGQYAYIISLNGTVPDDKTTNAAHIKAALIALDGRLPFPSQ
jgi:hypothetical protein